MKKWRVSGCLDPLLKFTDLSAWLCSPLALLPYELLIVRDVQQHFSSREDETLLPDYNVIFFLLPSSWCLCSWWRNYNPKFNMDRNPAGLTGHWWGKLMSLGQVMGVRVKQLHLLWMRSITVSVWRLLGGTVSLWLHQHGRRLMWGLIQFIYCFLLPHQVVFCPFLCSSRQNQTDDFPLFFCEDLWSSRSQYKCNTKEIGLAWGS